MASHDERYLLAFNGEIYNHLDLKNELQETGYSISWRGRSDTEVVLAAIVAWGLEAALEKFIGMFSFALWDKKNQEMLLVRDRIGEKPLYYGCLKGDLVFGSELRALKNIQVLMLK